MCTFEAKCLCVTIRKIPSLNRELQHFISLGLASLTCDGNEFKFVSKKKRIFSGQNLSRQIEISVIEVRKSINYKSDTYSPQCYL